MESAGGVGGLGSMRAVLAILQWWGFNVTVIIINKWIFQKLDFKFPLTVSCIHFICSSIRAYVAIHVLKAKPLIQVEPEDRWKRIFPMSFVFCMNIVLGNVSLRYIPVSFMQTIKSFTPATTGATICMHQSLDLYMLVMQWDTDFPVLCFSCLHKVVQSNGYWWPCTDNSYRNFSSSPMYALRGYSILCTVYPSWSYFLTYTFAPSGCCIVCRLEIL